MGDLGPRNYCYDRPRVHTWPGQSKPKCHYRNTKARVARFKAKHA